MEACRFEKEEFLGRSCGLERGNSVDGRVSVEQARKGEEREEPEECIWETEWRFAIRRFADGDLSLLFWERKMGEEEERL
jgi:hypothetical protein